MDVSLDDYISTSNFKIKIGNPGFKGNKATNVGNQGGFQQGKKRFGNFSPGNKVTDVSVTVPGGVPKVVGKTSGTNQVRDARDRLISKPQVQDARQKLSQKTPADARHKLQTIRARKGPVDARAKITGPVDARAKITAKQHQQQNVTITAPADKQPGFTLTRTVKNNNNSNMQVSGGAAGDIHITRTLTKVMPPGYEALVGATSSAAPPVQARTSNVKLRLGPQHGRKGTIPNITRTVANSNPQRLQSQPVPRPTVHTLQIEPQYENFPKPETIPQPEYHGIRIESHPRPQRIHAPPPQQFQPPPPQQYQPPPQQQYQPPPPPQQYQPPQYQPQSSQYPAPPSHGQIQPPSPEPSRRTASSEGPPYPLTDPIPVRQTVLAPRAEMPLPRFHVQNDQYRPTPPPQPYPPYPTQAPPHQYPYSPPPQQSYYPPTQAEPVVRRTIPNTEPRDPQPYVKTVVNDRYEEDLYEHSSLKRKATSSSSSSGPLRLSTAGGSSNSAGPLRLSSTNTIPVLTNVRGSPDRSAYRQTREEPPAKRPREEPPPDELNTISPLQGYKIAISNLHTTVTQDDIIELFGAIGAVKKVKLVKPGLAEVMYVKREHAIEATKIYHERELDGLPMVVKMMTSVSARVREPPETLPPSMKPEATGPLKLSKKPPGPLKPTDKKSVEVDVLHKALFKTGAGAPSKPVTFTVNI